MVDINNCNRIVGNNYKLGRKIDSGSFGKIFLATHVETHETVAVKMKNRESKHPQLLYEAKLQNYLQGLVGVVAIHWSGIDVDDNVLILDLLGPSREDLCRKANQVKLNLSAFDNVVNDTDFCMKLAKEESMVLFPDKQTHQGSASTTSAIDLEEFCEKHYEKLLPIMADKYEHKRRKKEKLEEVKARLDFGDVRKKTTKTQESAYSESRKRSPRRYRTRQEEKVTSSKDLEVEDRVCPHTPTVIRKTQGIRKNILKAKTVEGDTGSPNHKSKSLVLKMTTSLNPG
ncbi:casein kinase I-like 3-like protein, partial [Tanacetum coccineum]